MGLDMYLFKKSYVKNWSYMNESEQHRVSVKKGGEDRKDIKPERVSYIVEEVGYWRKFNALHDWFVKNCQNGIDECQETYIDNEKLQELLGILKEVDKDNTKAEELLPTSEGFFFGSTNYDEYYFQDVRDTIVLLESLLAEDAMGDYYYRSSW